MNSSLLRGSLPVSQLFEGVVRSMPVEWVTALMLGLGPFDEARASRSLFPVWFDFWMGLVSIFILILVLSSLGTWI